MTSLAIPLVLSLAIPLAGCSSGGGGGGKDNVAPEVSASPGSTIFNTSTITVMLNATDNRKDAPTIHYTTDATEPTDMSPVYTGPLTIDNTTVLKFFAVDKAGNESEVQVAGYTRALFSIEQQWAESGHGDILAEPFRHWDEEGEVQASCARCHTGPGFQDFIADGVSDNPAPLPLGHYCFSCHTSPPFTYYDDLADYPFLEPIEFPSEEVASLRGPSNMCMSCHQGRSAKPQVDAAIEANPDGPYRFINIHYYAAAASVFGSEVHGAYEYEGFDYVGKNAFPSHPTDLQNCVGCHMRGDAKDHHFLPQVSDCNVCHTGSSFETLSGSPSNNHQAIATSHDQLLDQIQEYARSVIGTPIAYSGSAYPYFYVDDNGNGIVDPDEHSSYGDFDAHLLKAAYNYQVVEKDPGGFVHNGTYLRQVLHDSITDLGGVPIVPAPGRFGFNRDQASKADQWHLSGHGNSLGEPFHHWDGEGEVEASCARCHSTPGYVDYVRDGVIDDPVPVGTLVECKACHQSPNLFADATTRYAHLGENTALEPIEFPSGAMATLNGPSNMCMACHQGRESGVSVDSNPPNTAVQSPIDYPSFDFVNRHYFAAGAILFGSDVTANYEYAGRTYKGQNTFSPLHDELVTCVGCHMRGITDHNFVPKTSDCDTCHQGVTDFEQLGLPFGAPNVDYDADGTGESFQGEIDGVQAILYFYMQNYAVNGLPQASPIVYAPGVYPYWFKDSDGDGQVSPGEATFANRYRDFDRKLLRAAYNYHCAEDPASDIHNYKYVIQTLYDSSDDLDNGVLDGSAIGIRP